MGKEFDIVKLNGSDSYHVWKFAVQNVIDYNGLSDALVASSSLTPNTAKMTNGEKLGKAKTIISLSVEAYIYAHIKSAGSALEIWNILKILYEYRGLSRRITLLRELISIRLEDSEGMNDYIGKIKSTSNKLTGIGFNLTSEWLGAIMLAGLTDEFRPLIMGIETNNEAITDDLITSKLLDIQVSSETNAFFSKNKKKKFGIKVRKCYSCGSTQHLSKTCDKKESKSDKCEKNNKTEKHIDSEKKAAFVALMCSEKRDEVWYLDSGAGRHMTPNDNEMYDTKTSNISEIISANSEPMKVIKRGKLKIDLKEHEITADDVLHVPDLAANLLSVYQIAKKGYTVIFDKNGCIIKNVNGEVIAFIKPTNGVYKLYKSTNTCFFTENKKSAIDALTWHRRLGHMNLGTMQQMKKYVAGIDFVRGEDLVRKCEICSRAKSCRLPFKPSDTKTTEILELIHSDVMGDMEIQSIGHARYCVTFIDDFSRKVFVVFLKHKSKVFDEFKKFKSFVQKQTGKSIKKFRSDSGGEYESNAFKKFLDDAGIQHQLTVPYTPQQNGLKEPIDHWLRNRNVYFLMHNFQKCIMAVYIMNHSLCAALKDKSSDEVFFDKKVDISEMKIFGSKVMAYIPKQKR